MTSFERAVFLVSADPALTEQFISSFVASGAQYQLPLAISVAQAQKGLHRVAPTVILLDESACQPCEALEEQNSESLTSAVASLTEAAPVVIVAAPERQSEMAFLISSGAVDFVGRVGSFVALAVALVERRVRLAEQVDRAQSLLVALSAGHVPSDFGEILRHEVNNPLTGILGNAELLLAECRKRSGEQLSFASLQRLQTIAELAVRLRETVRRLSNAWESGHEHARSA